MKLKPTQNNLDKLELILSAMADAMDHTVILLAQCSGPSDVMCKARASLEEANMLINTTILEYEK